MKWNLLKWTLAALCCVLISPAAQAPPEASTTIDLSGPLQWKPFPHFWEQMFGSGRANLSLRDSYRQDLRATRQITNFTYVRFHAILDDENGVYSQDSNGNPVYNFSYVDQIYDGLLENGVKPFVELSFMPKALAANPKPHPFWYKPLPSPPNDPANWAALITAFTRHLIERYGGPEVESWYFEVWNEPNIDFWDGEPKQRTYFALYDVTAKAIKDVDQKLRVGGPATAQAAWVSDFIAHCTRNHVPFDFVSTHIYGNEDPKLVFGKPVPMSDRDMVGASARKVADEVRNSSAPGTPIIWSEYNATYLNRPELTDSAFMGPWLANNIRECDGLTSMMSLWTFSDVFEEQGVVKTPFYGGYGLIAERGIPKPAFRAMQLLHLLGDQRAQPNLESALVTRRSDGAEVVALWNYSEPDAHSAPKTFSLKLPPNAHAHYIYMDPDHASAFAAWQRMGSPALPTLEQIRQLRAASTLPGWRDLPRDGTLTLPDKQLVILEIRTQ